MIWVIVNDLAGVYVSDWTDWRAKGQSFATLVEFERDALVFEEEDEAIGLCERLNASPPLSRFGYYEVREVKP